MCRYIYAGLLVLEACVVPLSAQAADAFAPSQLIYEAATQPDTTNNPPAIFYSPHQDDESLAMGASIAEHVRVGRPVYVVLLSRGNNDNMLDYLNAPQFSIMAMPR